MLVNDFPLLILLETLLAEVFAEVHAQLLFVEEAELLVEELLEATAADSLCLFHHRGVELTFTGVGRMPIEVDTRSPDISFLRRNTLVQVFIVFCES